jgi:murein DD-endopeptidase MepM/ murein hydrolase activator NlpD
MPSTADLQLRITLADQASKQLQALAGNMQNLGTVTVETGRQSESIFSRLGGTIGSVAKVAAAAAAGGVAALGGAAVAAGLAPMASKIFSFAVDAAVAWADKLLSSTGTFVGRGLRAFFQALGLPNAIISGYRFNDIGANGYKHLGLDIGGYPLGTIIRTPAAMQVVANTYDNIGGFWLKGRLPTGEQMYFGHLLEHGYGQVGQILRTGMPLGRIDTSGLATGPHIHFMYWDAQGRLQDPEKVFGYRHGGWIHENIMGFGETSGRRYRFHAPELVVPPEELARRRDDDEHMAAQVQREVVSAVAKLSDAVAKLEKRLDRDTDRPVVNVDARGALDPRAIRDAVDQGVERALRERDRRASSRNRMG